jgi:NAD(P)H dehydrogenase (quinone)
MKTIAITGSTGQLGRLVIEQLRTRIAADHIVALARNAAKAADLGVTVREANYNQPESLTEALKGVDALLLISSNELGQRAVQHRNVIAAAKAAGVPWIVYTSLLHAETSAITALSAEHLDTEAALKESGIPYTLLRNGWYTENYTASVPGAVAGGAFLGSAGEGRISSASRADYAEAAAIVLTTEGHQGKVYELAGDSAYTLTDLAAEISRQTGKQIPYKNLPEAEYATILAGFGLPAELANAFAGFDTGVAQGSLLEEGRQLSKLLGRPTTPLAVSVAAALGA